MKIATALMLLLIVAVAAASLAVDHADVGSQSSQTPYRVRVPSLARGVVAVGPVQPPPDALWFTVVIEVTAMDAEPEACCLPPTQIQLVGTDFLTQGTTIETAWNTLRMTQHPMPDQEGCTWTRVDRPRSGRDFGMRGQGLWGGGGGLTPFVALAVYHPRWAYSISGCRGLSGEETQERQMDSYLRDLFPAAPEGLILNTAPNPGQFVQCITHHGLTSKQGQYVTAKIEVYIYTAPCNIPQPQFPF